MESDGKEWSKVEKKGKRANKEKKAASGSGTKGKDSGG